MSRIHINIELDSNEPAFSAVLAALGQTAATTNVANTTVVDAEEVKAEEVKPETPAKTPTPRASRAKAKPEPTPVVEEEEETDEPDNDDLNELDQDEEEAEIDADDIRAVQATKVDKHREAIKAKLKEFGATGISSLDPVHFVKYHAFLTKLK